MLPEDRAREITAGFIEHMIEAVRDIGAFTSGVDEAAFVADAKAIAAVSYMFIKLGEASMRIPQDFREAHPEIPWAEMRKYRNFLTHAYEYVDAVRVWRVVCDDMPGLSVALPNLLRSVDPSAGGFEGQ